MADPKVSKLADSTGVTRAAYLAVSSAAARAEKWDANLVEKLAKCWAVKMERLRADKMGVGMAESWGALLVEHWAARWEMRWAGTSVTSLVASMDLQLAEWKARLLAAE